MTDRRAVPSGGRDALRQLYDGLVEVVGEIVGAPDLEHGCALLADFGVRHLGADMAGVSRQARRGGREVLAATDPFVTSLGAHRESAETASSTAPRVEDEVPVLAEVGLRSARRFDLPGLSSGTAVLELYSRAPNSFDTIAHEVLAHVVALAGTALCELERRANLESAVQTRGVIGQAQGIVMERYALSGEQAMGFLRRHSQETQQPVRELATEIVGRREAESRARGQRADP